MRPTLRPGLHVLRRTPDSLRLGLEWAGAAVVRDDTAVRCVIDAIDGCRDASSVVSHATRQHPEHDARACGVALTQLVDCGAVVDQSDTVHPDQPSAGVWSALWLAAGPSATAHDELAARAAVSIWVEGAGEVARAVTEALGLAGLRLAHASDVADLVVMCADHEPKRELADHLVRHERPHLWVHLRDLLGVIGPVVQPPATACLRCVDAARANLDPTWPTIVIASQVSLLRTAPAVDPLLTPVVAAWAAQLVVDWARDRTAGRGPTRAEVIEVAFATGSSRRYFDPHPECGCAWPQWHETMGA